MLEKSAEVSLSNTESLPAPGLSLCSSDFPAEGGRRAETGRQIILVLPMKYHLVWCELLFLFVFNSVTFTPSVNHSLQCLCNIKHMKLKVSISDTNPVTISLDEDKQQRILIRHKSFQSFVFHTCRNYAINL